MDKKLNNEQEKILLDAIERSQAYSRRLREDNFKRLWKETNNSYCLYDSILRLTKDEMTKIRQSYNFQGLSSLNKPELALQLSKLIPLKFDKVIYRLDQKRYDIIRGIINNSGTVKYNNMDIDQIRTFMEYSIIFPGLTKGEAVLFMPVELMERFRQIDGSELKRVIQRNTEWIRLTYGMINYYGVMETWAIKERIEELKNQQINILELMDILNMASDFDVQIRYTHYGYSLFWILEPEKIVEEHKKRPSVEYYPFTEKQLLKASVEDYVDRTPELNRFTGFLSSYYEFTVEELDEIALQVVNIINFDLRPTTVIDYLQTIIEIPSFEFAQELSGKIMDLHNGTRQWAIKGYSPNELLEKERKFLNPLPAKISSSKQESNVISIQTRKKIGRNDPCPCESEKKYKRCCGK